MRKILIYNIVFLTILCSYTSSYGKSDVEIILEDISNDQSEYFPDSIAFPTMNIKNGMNGGQPCVRMTQLTINVEVEGKIATTTYDMIFESDCDHVLEGELEFPLGDGQTISKYALDVDGKMREGVVVDKTKARKTFESIVRRGVDPGLVEKTKGNNFKARVYPISKKRPRHIRITYNQEIKTKDGKQVYSLPLYSETMLNQFSLKVRVVKRNVQTMVKSSFENIVTVSSKKEDVMSLQKEYVVLKDYFNVEVPVSKENSVWTKKDGKDWFFYLTPTIGGAKLKTKPKSIAVVFDVSGSAEKRNIDKELSLLRKYMEYIGSVDVRVVTFSNQVHSEKLIQGAAFSDVERVVKEQPLDGGTQMGVLDLASYKEDEILLFSDGISNFGKKEATLPEVPLYAIHTSLISDFAYLSKLSGKGGACLNLNGLTEDEAFHRLSFRYPQLMKIKCKKVDAEEIFPMEGSPVDENFAICGKTSSKKVDIVLSVLNVDNTISTIKYAVKPTEEDAMALDRIWAQKRLAALETDAVRNKEKIKELALKYGLVSDYTSLIVLETMEDYRRYGIEPPAGEDVREEPDDASQMFAFPDDVPFANSWTSDDDVDVIEGIPDEITLAETENFEYDLAETDATAEEEISWSAGYGVAVQGGLGANNSSSSLNYSLSYNSAGATSSPSVGNNIGLGSDAIAMAEENDEMIFYRVDKRASFPGGREQMMNFLKENLVYPQDAIDNGIQGRVMVKFVVSPSGSIRDAQVVRSVYPSLDEEALRVVRSMPNWIPAEIGNEKCASYFFQPISFKFTSDSATRTEPLHEPQQPRYFQLPVTRMVDERGEEPDYLKEIKNIPEDKRYAYYLETRKKHDDVLYFLDMADYFRSIGQRELAMRILSNIAELKLEDSEVIRSLGGKLMEYGYYELAAESYKDVLGMREEEPQSYRDLALAYEALGNYQEAYRLLDTVTNGKWDRFKEIKEVSTYEMDELVALHPSSFRRRRVSDDFGMDLRIVISWNTDNADMDLWVVDPHTEACGYSHKKTEIGGEISYDFTKGYGPEAFTLKKAIPGTYKVYLNYYGTTSQRMLQPVIVRVSIFRNYGRPNQTCQERMATLDTVNGWILLDKIVVE